jgi:phosphate transport system protein
MGRLVDAHVGEAVRALLERDRELAARVIDADRAVNQMELAIDEQCIRTLALYQPAASDLRFIAAALKIVTDLERIGDLAVNMAERVELLAGEVALPAVEELPTVAAAARKMLESVLDAFVEGDAGKAQEIIRADADIDVRTARIIADVQRGMEKDPRSVTRGVATIFFAKHIERMADHATNIAEMVVYLVRGQDVRHASST